MEKIKKGMGTILLIHDWPEVITGDMRSDPLTPKPVTKKEKEEKERAAMEKICGALGKKGKMLLALWKEFERGKSLRAILARQTERAQRIIKALEYEKDGEPVIAQEFIDYYGPSIENEKLRSLISSHLTKDS